MAMNPIGRSGAVALPSKEAENAEIQIKIIRLSVLINATINFVEIYWILYMAIWACREGEVKGFLGTNETASSSIFLLLFCDSVWGTLTKLLISLKNLVLMNFGLK